MPEPSLRTVFWALARCIEWDHRSTLSKACLAYSVRTAASRASRALYDCTTLYLETET